MRRIVGITALLAASMALFAVLASPAQSVAGFGDVAAGRYYTAPVQWMVDNEFTTGTTPTCFSPDDPVTRGQAAAFLWRIEGSPTGAAPHPFSDVVRSWQQAPVSWMAEEGITTGTSPSTYSPDDTLTRGQMAAMVHRAAGNPAASPTGFADVWKDWQVIAVGWMEAEGITTGTSPLTFSPERAVTRGEFAAFAYRWKGSPRVSIDSSTPACAPAPTPTSPRPDLPPDAVFAVDWWGCWRAADALDATSTTPTSGENVAALPNCATGPSSVGAAGDMSHPSAPPIFRPSGANGHQSIEFTFAGNTLLQTAGGTPWSGGDVLDGTGRGVTLAWIGMTTDIAAHDVKYLVSGLSDQEYPQLLIDSTGGVNQFMGYGGGNTEARSSPGTITDKTLHGVVMYLAPDNSASVVEVDGVDVRTGQDSAMRRSVTGLTLGNIYSRGFSTTDHQFVFLGMHEGAMTASDKNAFWSYLDDLRS